MNRWLLAVLSGVLVMVAVVVALGQPLVALAIVGGVAWLLTPRKAILSSTAVATIAMMVIFPIQYLEDYPGLSRAVSFLVPALTMLAFMRTRQRPHFGVRVLPWASLAYVVILVIATFGDSAQASAQLMWATFIPAICLVLLVSACDGRQVRRFENSVVALSCIEALYALLEVSLRLVPIWTTQAAERASQIIPGATRAQGTLGHPLPLAMLCVVGLGVLLARRHSSTIAMTTLGCTVLVAGIVATGSRSAILVAAVMLAFSIGRKAWSAIAAALLLIGIGTAALASLGFFSSQTWLKFIAGDSVTHRSGALSSVPGLISDQSAGAVVFGNGYFAAAGLFARGLLQRGSFYAIDNQFVTTLVEAGLIGVILLLILLLAAWLHGEEYRFLVFGAVAFFFSFDVLSWPSATSFVALTIGLILMRSRKPFEPLVNAHQGLEVNISHKEVVAPRAR